MTSILSPRESSTYSTLTGASTKSSGTAATNSSKITSSIYTTTATGSNDILTNGDSENDPRKISSGHELSSRHSSASRPSSRTALTRQSKSVMWVDDLATAGRFMGNISPTLLNEFERKKRNREKKVEQRLFALHKDKQRRIKEEKEAAENLEKRLPMDILAREWFNTNPSTAEIRVYLIEKLMPTLILGMEKILLEADKRGLLENESEEETHDRFGCSGVMSRPRFNPINELAQYLMRNNPRFSNYPESSQYARGLHAVAEELKQEVFDMDSNKLAKLKYEAQKNRERLEDAAKKIKEERELRDSLLRKQFDGWLLDSDDMLQLQLIQNAVFSFLEIASHVSPDQEIKLNKDIGPTDESGTTLSADDFVKYIDELVVGQPQNIFDDLLRHLDQCALAFRKTFQHEMWNSMFTKLFDALDSEGTGCLDRHRMIHLLEKYWDKMESREGLRNPRKWPVIELEESDDLYPESDDDSVIVSTQMDSDTVIHHEDEEQVSIEWEEKMTSSSPTEKDNGSSEDKDTGEKQFESITSKEEDATKDEENSQPQEESEDNNHVKEEADKKTEEKVQQEVEQDLSKDNLENLDDTTPEIIVQEESAELQEVNDQTKEDTAEVGKDKEDGETKKTDEEEAVEKEKDTENGHDESTDVVAEQENKEEVPVTVEEDFTTDSKPVEVVDSSEDIQDKKEEDKKEDIPVSEDLKQKLLEGGDQPITLTTPALTEEDDGAVKIQFSKEMVPDEPIKVRKTTSLSVVHKKKPAAISDEVKTAAPIVTIAGGDAPLQALPKQAETESETLESIIESSSFLVQHTEADMNDDDDDDNQSLFPVEVKTRQASASRMSVSFAAEPVILPDKPSQEFFSQYSSRSQSRMTSVFDEAQLNKNRFVALLETFLDDDAENEIVESLVNFIHGGYVETEEEKMARLAKARQDALLAKHREMIDNLFNKWDNDGQGYIDIDQVEDVLSKYKGGMEASALKEGKMEIRKSRKHHVFDKKTNRREFTMYINKVCDSMVGGEEVFDGLIEFATTTVERTYAERVRGEARRKWLAQVKLAAECSGATMEPVYRAIFQTIFKDAEAHGGQKKASAYIALLENNMLYPERGNLLLRYVACTPDNAPHMLGKSFYEDMRGISFYCVRRGKLVHVPRVRSHGRVYFWNPIRLEEEKEGSLILLPLKDEQRRIYGLMGIDNLDDPADRSVFSTHELNYYQGIARAFSSAFHHIDLRRKLLRIIDSAMSWIHSRAPKVLNITVYFVEPDPKSQAGHVLRKMMTANNTTGVTTIHKRPSRLYRKDNLFRDYLFKCMESSETTTADAYGERHTAYPLRDDEGRCQCVVDISIGKLRMLPKHERREIQRMLKLLQEANREVLRESVGGEKIVVLEVEATASDEGRVEVMFDRLMLTDLRDNVKMLDNNVFAELHNYKDPPPIIHNILKSVIMLFHQNPEKFQQFDDWVKCKQLSTTKLKHQIVEFDPTAEGAVTPEVHEQLSNLLKGIAHGAVAKHGSRPAQQLYNWAFVCLSLIEHTQKMADSSGQPAITPINSASTATTDTTQAESEMY